MSIVSCFVSESDLSRQLWVRDEAEAGGDLVRPPLDWRGTVCWVLVLEQRPVFICVLLHTGPLGCCVSVWRPRLSVVLWDLTDQHQVGHPLLQLLLQQQPDRFSPITNIKRCSWTMREECEMWKCNLKCYHQMAVKTTHCIFRYF